MDLRLDRASRQAALMGLPLQLCGIAASIFGAATASATGLSARAHWWMLVTGIVAAMLGTVLLGAALRWRAQARAQSPWWQLTAGLSLIGVLLVSLLPDEMERPAATELMFICPHCGTATQFGREHIGARGHCRVCGLDVTIEADD